MRHSANLNIIVKAVQKASANVSRDFIELENLQSNPTSAAKFTAACYNRVKQILADDLGKLRPDYNLIFADGEKIIRNQNAEYSYVVFPIDGVDNLLRASPDFTVAVALQHHAQNGEKESIAAAVSKIFGNEIFYCEKGFGAYLHNRRMRVSKRQANDFLLGVCDDEKALAEKLSGKKFVTRNFGCRTQEIAYLAAARLDFLMLKKENFDLLKPFLLFIREAGGKISEQEGSIFAGL